MTDGEPYRLLLSRSARKALTDDLPEAVGAAAYAFITDPLVRAPYRVGGPLDPPLAPARSARRGEYRALYVVDDAQRSVKVTAIRHRRDAYRPSTG